MKRFSLLLIAICCLRIAAMAQGACYPAGVVLLDTGRPANGASVSVCNAGGTFPGCTSTTSLFTTPALSVAASNPVTTDTHGNFGFCAAAGVNYDLKITGSGITPYTIFNLPLPVTTPVTANALTSSSANPANVGLIKLASGDCVDWRNNANSGNIQLCKTATDAMDATAFSAVNTKQIALLTSGGTLPATIANDTLGGLLFTTNAGKGWQMANSTGQLQGFAGVTILLQGSSSGSVTLAVPSAAGSNTLTFPAATGTLSCNTCSQTLTATTLSGPAINSPTMNGTVINGIPSVMQFSCTGTATAASTLSLSGGACTNTLAVLFPVSSSATIANLRCKSQSAGVNASSGVVTARKNGVAQTLTCTIGTGTTCSDLTHSFSLVPGDTVDLIFTTQTAETLGNIGCTVEKQ